MQKKTWETKESSFAIRKAANSTPLGTFCQGYCKVLSELDDRLLQDWLYHRDGQENVVNNAGD